MKWADIEILFASFGWKVTSDFAVVYQEEAWVHRLVHALLSTVADRDEIESTIKTLTEDREDARIEVGELQAELDDADELTVGERRNYRRLQELVDVLAACPTVDAPGTAKALVVTPEQLSELARLATFPAGAGGVAPKFATGGVIPATRIWSAPIDPPEIYIDGKRVEVRPSAPPPPSTSSPAPPPTSTPTLPVWEVRSSTGPGGMTRVYRNGGWVASFDSKAEAEEYVLEKIAEFGAGL